MRVMLKHDSNSYLEIISIQSLGGEGSWRKIGEGGYSDVFMGKYYGSTVAIKKFRSSEIDINSPEFRKELTALRCHYHLRNSL